MRRCRLFNLVSLVSGVLLVASTAMWVRGAGGSSDAVRVGYWNLQPRPRNVGYFNGDILVVLHRGGAWTVSVTCVPCVHRPDRHPAGPGPEGRRWRVDRLADSEARSLESLAWGWGNRPAQHVLGFRALSHQRSTAAALPDWAVTGAFAVLPLSLSWLRCVGVGFGPPVAARTVATISVRRPDAVPSAERCPAPQSLTG